MMTTTLVKTKQSVSDNRSSLKLLVLTVVVLVLKLSGNQALISFQLIRGIFHNYRYMYLKIARHLKTYIDANSSIDFEKLH